MHDKILGKVFFTIVGSGLIGLPIFGINMLLFFVVLYLLASSVDFLSGYLASKEKGAVDSKIGIFGFLRKTLILLIICFLVLVASGINYFNDLTSASAILIGIIPHVVTCIFIFLEFASILENCSVIFSGTKEGKFFDTLTYLVNKLFNSSLDKLKERAEEKINNRINNI